jgi:two-component system chemotaxis response regulator CheB
MIRVLVTDDSPLMCKILTNVLNSDPQILVTGVAIHGREALDLVPHLKPNIITMDIDMPIMDGFEATKMIMASHPTPILIVSSSVFISGTEKVFEAISCGALDVIDKSELELGGDKKSGETLIAKVKFLNGIRVKYKPTPALRKERSILDLKTSLESASDRIVAMVASTGGPQALLEILKRFPGDFPSGIVVVQHITSGFLSGLRDWLDKECKIKVKIGEDSEEIQPGVAYLAPEDLQMRVVEGRKISLTDGPPHGGHRPSGDILLESVAKVYGRKSIGVILTGMGRDGANGMKAIKQSSGRTIAQHEKDCVIFGMPSVAIEMNVIDRVLPLEKIAEEIGLWVRSYSGQPF